MARLKDERKSFKSSSKTEDAKETILKELIRLQKKNSFRHELVGYIKAKGYPETDLDILLQEASNLADKIALNSLPKINLVAFIIFSLSAIVSLILIFRWLPFQNFDSLWASFLATLIFLILTMLSIAFYGSWKPKLESINRPKNFSYTLFLIIAIIPYIILTFVIDYNIDRASDRSLEKNGEYAIGRILSHTNYNIRIKRARSTVSYVKVKYLSREREEITVKIEIPSGWHGFLPRNQKVLVKYDKKNPDHAIMVFDKKLIGKYTGSQMRLINVSDLLQLIKMPNSKVISFLDKIVYGFSFDKETVSWQNKLYGLALKRRFSGNIEYTFNDNQIKNILHNELMEAGFEKRNRYFNRGDSIFGDFGIDLKEEDVIMSLNLVIKQRGK